ncbi:hypothetical protein LVB77_14655 [Lysobacter sp. 5GHs7-4]|uniref:hypothetical protein n=1 Tax=Lysobacter sp. 5GHs7-4 TaxID=2904253 RepID=UPI001E312EF2|nr:hypothetical protein [Lysobacter sp. 5GHs7-4]UHQ21907.1 hypothetical protein LVB77_14655 [Lysobacter sp. 5GHs7-4]
MDLQRRGNGLLHFSLGPVEKWVAGIVASAFVAGCWWFVSNVTEQLEKLNSAQVTQSTQLQLLNQQLQTLNLQLADMPTLRQSMVELKVRVEKHDEEIKELRSVRNLK